MCFLYCSNAQKIILSHMTSIAHRTDTQISPRGFPALPRTKPGVGRICIRFLNCLEVVSRGCGLSRCRPSTYSIPPALRFGSVCANSEPCATLSLTNRPRPSAKRLQFGNAWHTRTSFPSWASPPLPSCSFRIGSLGETY